MRRLSFGTGAVIAIVALGCSRGDSSPASRSESVAASPGELFQPNSSPAATALEKLALEKFLINNPDGTPRAFLTRTDVDTMRMIAEGYEVRPSSLKNQPAALKAYFPQTASGTLSVFAGSMRADVQPHGFGSSNIEWSDHLAVYRGAADKLDMFRVANTDGIEDFYLVDAPKNDLSFSYTIGLTNVAGLRLVSNTLELLDANGTPRLRMPTPMLVDARGKVRAGTLAVSGCAFDSKPIGPWGRPVTAPGAASCTVTASLDGRDLSYPVLVDPAWQSTANMKQTRAYHRLIYIQAGADSGKVIAAGGTGTLPLSTELFDPATLTWSASSDLPTLPSGGFGIGSNGVGFASGAVFLAGGLGTASGMTSTVQATTALRNPTTGTWSPKAAMDARTWHAMAVTTIDGKESAVVIGGQPYSFLSSGTYLPLKSAQWYEPVGDNWTNVGGGGLVTARSRSRAVTLTDGRILVAGGEVYSAGAKGTNTAEIFSPTTKTFTATANMTADRDQPELVALTGGPRAIVAGGAPTSSIGFSGPALDTLEYFDGTTWKLLTVKLSQPKWQFTSARLADGKVLFAGGQITVGTTTAQTATADLFNPGADPSTGTIVGGGSLNKERMFLAAATIPTLGAIVSGGISVSSETTASDLFNTKVGGVCGTGCPSGTTCVDGVCCMTATCGTGEKCNAPGREGICTKPAGATCGGNNECASGYCVGSYCCETACSGTCRSCDSTGKCNNAPAGRVCAGGGECGLTCDALGNCTTAYVPAGTKCGASATDAGTGTFCSTQACNGSNFCATTTNNCGLTCTTSVTCNEATKTCTASAAGIKAGFCVIDAKCYSYGDINPTDSCKVCDPPSSKTAWSTAVACMDGSVDTGSEDTGPVEDTGEVVDTGEPEDTGIGDDTGATGDDTGTEEDASADAAIGSDLPEVSTCSCRTPGGTTTGPGALAAIGIALAVAARRRRK